MLFHPREICNLSVAEAVNTLIWISNDGDFVKILRKKAHELILRGVGVLELIDEHSLDVRHTLRVGTHEEAAAEEQIVIVQEIRHFQLRLVLCENLSEFLISATVGYRLIYR